MKWLSEFIDELKEGGSVSPSWDIPLQDKPGKLISTRIKYHSSGRIEVVETKFNLTEYERLKPIIKRMIKP